MAKPSGKSFASSKNNLKRAHALEGATDKEELPVTITLVPTKSLRNPILNGMIPFTPASS